MENQTNPSHYILLGGAEHLPFFENHENFQTEKWFWTVPKSAKIGDIGFVYLCAPVSRIVGQIEIIDEPFFNQHTFPTWQNNWMSEIGNVKFFAPCGALTIKGLRALFPDWSWLRYPRGKTRIPAEILTPLLELINDK